MTQESTEIIYPASEFGLLMPKPNYMLSFHKDGKQVGTFDFNEGKMHFKGDVSDSGQIFVDWVVNAFKQRIEDAVKAEREACAKLFDERDKDIGWYDPGEPAEIIRARGQA
jgi:hypothetical protein